MRVRVSGKTPKTIGYVTMKYTRGRDTNLFCHRMLGKLLEHSYYGGFITYPMLQVNNCFLLMSSKISIISHKNRNELMNEECMLNNKLAAKFLFLKKVVMIF